MRSSRPPVCEGQRCPRKPKRSHWSRNRDRSAHRRLRRQLLARARGRCESACSCAASTTNVNSNGIRCPRPIGLRACHIIPLAKGGGYDPSNGV